MSTSFAPPVPIKRSGSGLPSRVIYHGVEGIGKSSTAAYSPRPIFIMTKGETGLLTLIDNGQVPETDHFDEIESWPQLLQAIDYMAIDESRDNRTLVLDTLNGAQNLLFKHVCETKYGDNMDSFLSFAKGPDVAAPEWNKFLAILDRLREVRRMSIIALCHTKIKAYKNPSGDDYDRFTPDMNDKIWGLSAKWADIVLFGNYLTFAKKGKGELKAKGFSDGSRMIYTQRTAAWDAKNRQGLPAEIDAGQTPQETWQNLYGAMKAARQEGLANMTAAKPAITNGSNGNTVPAANSATVNNVPTTA